MSIDTRKIYKLLEGLQNEVLALQSTSEANQKAVGEVSARIAGVTKDVTDGDARAQEIRDAITKAMSTHVQGAVEALKGELLDVIKKNRDALFADMNKAVTVASAALQKDITAVRAELKDLQESLRAAATAASPKPEA